MFVPPIARAATEVARATSTREGRGAAAVSVEDLLEPIARGDLRGWQGLAHDLTIRELTSAYPPDSDWSGSAQLGRRHREASYRWIRFPSADAESRAWFVGEQVILLDLANPSVGAHYDQLTEMFGAPDASLDTWQDTLPMPASETVYARRGIAVFVNLDTGAIWHLALFAPVTLEVYQDDLASTCAPAVTRLGMVEGSSAGWWGEP
jgi:hypothetical protein